MHQDFICYTALIDTDTFIYLDSKILLHAVLPKKPLPSNATVGQCIKHYRETRNIYIHQLAVMTGISRHALMDYEADHTEPILDHLNKIADAINVEVDKLYDDYYCFMAYPFSAKVRQTRKNLKLTQRDFGAFFDLGRRAVERWESGENQVSREVWEQMREKKLL